MEHASGFSRRRFLATTAGVALAGSSSLPGAARAAGAKTLRIAAGEADGPKGTMDPALSTADPDAARISLAFERLVILDDTFTPKPQLAKSWEANAAPARPVPQPRSSTVRPLRPGMTSAASSARIWGPA